MAEKCPFCKEELIIVTPAFPRQGVVARLRCINPACPLAKLGRDMTMRELFAEAVSEKGKLIGKEWKEKGEPTSILCPNCGGGYIQQIGDMFRCPECRKEFKSEEEVLEKAGEMKREMKRRLGPRYRETMKLGRRFQREKYVSERKGIREKHGGKWYKYGLKRKYWEEARKTKRKHLGIPESMKTSEALKTNITTANVLTALIFVGAGFVLAAAAGNIYFMFAFLSIGLFTLFPAPPEYTGPPVAWGDMNIAATAFWHSSHHGLAFIRSIAKISAIVCFALAFRDFGGIMNIPFILICFGGYFSLKIRYNPKVPGELLESLLRFGVLGAYFIPFMVFRSIFESWVLVLIAIAFFAIPPIASGKEHTAVAVQGDLLLKIVFAVLMGVALIGSGALASIGFQPEMFGAGWALKGSMAYTFMYFWGISFIGGMFTPSDSRPVIGFIMILGATVIWGLGPGSQEVGSALLGQWWPAIHNAFNTIAEPLTDVFGALGETFGNAFLMITNPVAYAHQVMDGTYGQTGGTDKVGSFGVEISGFSIGTGMNDIYVEQPFQLMFTIKNEGGFDARNVSASLFTELTYQNLSEKEYVEIGGKDIPTEYKRKKVYIGELVGANVQGDMECTKMNGKCSEYTFYVDGNKNNELGQQDIRSFLMGGLLGCEVVERADLREKFIPINVEVRYDYEVQSSFQVEFLSQAEWSRRAQAGELVQRTEVSTVTTAPVKLSLSSMEQPIRAGTGFFIGMELKSMEGENSLIKPPVRVEVDIPREFVTLTQDSKVPCYGQATVTTDGKIIWEIKGGEGFKENVLYCDFYPDANKIVPGGNPSKTYYLDAKATYSFAKWERKDAKLAFGSWCCGDKDCEKIGKVCVKQPGEDKGNCQEEGAVPKPKECGELSFEECRGRADCQWRSTIINPETGELGLCAPIQ